MSTAIGTKIPIANGTLDGDGHLLNGNQKQYAVCRNVRDLKQVDHAYPSQPQNQSATIQALTKPRIRFTFQPASPQQ
jgi:hypothetical protein